MATASIESIEVRSQPRKSMSEEALADLATSIEKHGILEPLVVRAKSGGNGGYILELGHRRLEAAKRVGLKNVPILVRNVNANTIVLHQLIENLQREDMNEMDLAEAFEKVMETQGLSLDQLATEIGKTKGFVRQRLSLLKAAPEIQEAVRRGEIEFSAARALCGLPASEQATVLSEAIKEDEDARIARLAREAAQPSLIEEKTSEVVPETNEPKVETKASKDETKAAEKEPKQRKPKKTPEGVKAKTSTVRRVTKRAKRQTNQTPIKPIEERLQEKSQEWVVGFIDEDTKGVGIEDGLTALKVRNLMKRFCKYLLEQKVLLVR